MENIQKIKDLLETNQDTFDKFFVKGRANAGTAVRKLMQDLIGLAKAVRVEVQERKNAGKSTPSA